LQEDVYEEMKKVLETVDDGEDEVLSVAKRVYETWDGFDYT
jgi:hypothetical protein